MCASQPRAWSGAAGQCLDCTVCLPQRACLRRKSAQARALSLHGQRVMQAL